MASKYCDIATYDKALEAIQRALKMHQQRQDKRGLTTTYLTMGHLFYEIGDLKQAKAVLEKGLAIGREVNSSKWVVEGWLQLTQITLAKSGKKRLLEAKALLNNLSNLDDIPAHYYYLQAVIAYEQKQLKQSLDFIETAVTNKNANPKYIPQYQVYQAFLWSQQGQKAIALSQSQLALTKAQQRQNKDILKFVYLYRYYVLQKWRRENDAFNVIETAYNLIQQQKNTLPTAYSTQAFLQTHINKDIISIYNNVSKTYLRHEIQVFLPRVGVSQRGPLSSKEYTKVTWTIHLPSDSQIRGKKQRRRHRLQRLFSEATKQHAVPTIEKLAEALSVSERTIYYDLAALQENNVLLITRGSLSL